MRAARTDSNHAAITRILRQCGCVVQSLAAVGKGVPDLLVWIPRHKRLLLIEVKDGTKPPSERRLTEEQVQWHGEWRGAPVYIVSDVGQVLELVGAKESA